MNQKTQNELGRSPDFFCLGAQKAGVTWLHRVLSSHPQVWLPPGGEIGFFGSPRRVKRDLLRLRGGIDAALNETKVDLSVLRWLTKYALAERKDAAWYQSLFSDAGSRRAGEINAGYALLQPEQIQALVKAAPEAKFVFIMRNPIQRLWDFYKAIHPDYRYDKAKLIAEGRYWETLQKPECEAQTRYLTVIETWERFVSPDRMVYLFYDELTSDPMAFLEKVSRHLDIDFDPSHFPLARIAMNDGSDSDTPLVVRQFAAKHYLPEFERLAQRFGAPVTAWCAEMNQALRARAS